MKSYQPKLTRSNGPEAVIQLAVESMLRNRGWYVLRTQGNMYQTGFPDDFVTHTRYGSRWIEVKNPKAYSFTPAQLDVFPKLVANGTGVWVLVADTDSEYDKLFKACNWYQYLKY